MPNMRPVLLALTLLVALCCVAAEPAAAQMAPGSIGNAGRMPETMSPGAAPPPPTPQAMPVQPPPAPYPNTQSMARDRVQSQGYTVRKVEPRPDGSWRVDATRGAVPTRPQGYQRSITIHPDGRETVEY